MDLVEELQRIAELARIELSKEESETLGEEVQQILEYIRQLEAIDVSDIEPMSHVHGVTNVFREDEVERDLAVDEYLSIVPDRSGRSIRVPIVIE